MTDRTQRGVSLSELLLVIVTGTFAALHWDTLRPQFGRFGLHRPAALVGLAALVPLLAVNDAYHGWLVRALGIESATLFERLREMGVGEGTLVIAFALQKPLRVTI